MSENSRIVTVNCSNVDEQGFFCYKSKKKSDGYRNKLDWLRARLDEGIVIKILYEGARSVGYEARGIETRAIKLESSEDVQARSPSAYGIFGIVYEGKLFSCHYLGKRELKQLDEMLS